MENTQTPAPSLNEALEISKEWKILTDARLSELIEESETVSDVMLAEIKNIKQEAFGEGNYEVTDYEKKLMLSGVMLAQEMSARKMAAAAQSALLSALMSKLNSEE